MKIPMISAVAAVTLVNRTRPTSELQLPQEIFNAAAIALGLELSRPEIGPVAR